MDTPSSTPTPSGAVSGGNSTPTAPSKSTPTNAVAQGGKTPTSAAPDSKHADKSPNVPPAPAGETPAQAAARKYKIKVDGGETEIDLGSLKDEQIVKALQMEKVAYKRMQEKAELERKYNALREQLKTDPRKALKEDPEIGIDIRKQVEEELIREYKESQMSEEARRAAQLERELQARDAEIKRIADEKQAEQRRILEDRLYQETEAQFVEALESSDLPRTRETLYMMGQIAKVNLANGLELTPAQMAAETKSRLAQIHQYVTRNLKGEALVSHLGEDVVKEVLRHEVKKRKAQQASQMTAPPPAKQPDVTDLREQPERKPVDVKDARKFFRGLK